MGFWIDVNIPSFSAPRWFLLVCGAVIVGSWKDQEIPAVFNEKSLAPTNRTSFNTVSFVSVNGFFLRWASRHMDELIFPILLPWTHQQSTFLQFVTSGNGHFKLLCAVWVVPPRLNLCHNTRPWGSSSYTCIRARAPSSMCYWTALFPPMLQDLLRAAKNPLSPQMKIGYML